MADLRQNSAIKDDFNRVENPLTGVPPGTWALLDNARSQLKDTGTQAKFTTGFTGSYSYWTPESWDGDDAEAWAYTKGGNSPAQAWGMGLFVGSSLGGTDAADGYLWRMEMSTAGGATRMYRITDMARTVIDTNPDSPPTGGEWEMLIRRNGNDVEGWANAGDPTNSADWIMYVSATDLTYTTDLHATLHLNGTLVGFDYFGGGPGDFARQQIYRVLQGTRPLVPA